MSFKEKLDDFCEKFDKEPHADEDTFWYNAGLNDSEDVILEAKKEFPDFAAILKKTRQDGYMHSYKYNAKIAYKYFGTQVRLWFLKWFGEPDE